MNVFGTIKPPFKINAFTMPVFKNRFGYYEQVEKDGKIIDFIKLDIDDDDLLACSEPYPVKKGTDSIECFMRDDGSVIVGSMDKIRDQLIDLLNDSGFDPIAKVLISSRLNLHGKVSDYIGESNTIMKKERFNCELDEKRYLSKNYVKDIDTKIFCRTLRKYNANYESKKLFEWKDIIEIIDRNKIVFDNHSYNIDLFSLKINEIESEHSLKKKITEGILNKATSDKITDNTVAKNRNLYKLIEHTRVNQKSIDNLLSPFVCEHINSKGYRNSIMIKGYNIEEEISRKSKFHKQRNDINKHNDLKKIARNIQLKLSRRFND